MSDKPLDLDKFRHLEVRVRHWDGEGSGFTERTAQSFGRLSADALAIIRVLFEEDGLRSHMATFNPNGEPIGTSALFHMWLAFTGEIAGRDIPEDDPEAAKQIVFLRRVMQMMTLAENFSRSSNPPDPANEESDPR